jgi:hypothetical protein
MYMNERIQSPSATSHTFAERVRDSKQNKFLLVFLFTTFVIVQSRTDGKIALGQSSL